MGGPQDALIKAATDCFSPGFKFPGIADPGLPKFLIGLFMTSMGGVSLVLDYLPVPDPKKIPKLKVPTLDFFLDIFKGAVGLPSTVDASGALNFILTCVWMIFSIFKDLILSILKLSPKPPTLDLAISLFKKYALQFNLPKDLKVECVPKAVIGLLKTLLPI